MQQQAALLPLRAAARQISVAGAPMLRETQR